MVKKAQNQSIAIKHPRRVSQKESLNISRPLRVCEAAQPLCLAMAIAGSSDDLSMCPSDQEPSPTPPDGVVPFEIFGH
jgi:hypothetical protein